MIETGAALPNALPRRQPIKRGGDGDLRSAEAEHQPAHLLEPLVGQFQPDQEQQKHDAEFGDAGDVFGVDDGDPIEKRDVRLERAQAERTQHARQRRDSQGSARRRRRRTTGTTSAGSAQHHKRVAIGIDVDRRGHGTSYPATRLNCSNT